MQGGITLRRNKMKKCAICGARVISGNTGFSDLLSNEEKKKILNLQPKETICTECKFIVMAVEIISPFYN